MKQNVKSDYLCGKIIVSCIAFEMKKHAIYWNCMQPYSAFSKFPVNVLYFHNLKKLIKKLKILLLKKQQFK